MSPAVPAHWTAPDAVALPAGVQWLVVRLPGLVVVAKPGESASNKRSELLGNWSATACGGCRLGNCLPQSHLHLLDLGCYQHLPSLTVLVSCFRCGFPCLRCPSLELYTFFKCHVHFLIINSNALSSKYGALTP